MAGQGFSFAHLPGGFFDARSVDPSPSFTVPPMDDYIVGITAFELKETADKTGGYLRYTLEIQQSKAGSTQLAKVTVPYILNIFNADGQTVAIAYKQLSALGHVTGKLQLQSPQDLICNPQTGQGFFIATIGPQKENPQYSKVYAVKDLQGNAPGKQGTAAITASPVQPAPAGFPPQPPNLGVQPGQPQGQPAWGPPQTQFNPAPVQQPPVQAQPPWVQPGQPQPINTTPTPSTPPWAVPQAPAQAQPTQQAQPPWAVPQNASPTWPPQNR